jgi:arylsulfatase A-like enzyme
MRMSYLPCLHVCAVGRLRIFAAILCCWQLTQLQAAERPNIVLCMADDQGWGDTAYNGHPLLKTPNLDAMASEGLRFDHFYAAAPVCSPTRGSVLTGRNPNRFGCFSWGHALRPQEVTIAERLQEAGYATGHFGKWHLGSVLKGSPVNPGASGFDEWLSAFNFYDNDPVLSAAGRATEVQGESSMIAADAAIEFIRRSAAESKPFLAVVWFGSPHSPHRAAAEDLAHYEGKKHAQWMGEITGLDRAVGKIRSALQAEGLRENTLFWYTSDNGGLQPASSGGRDKKGSIYEGGLRVPAIIEWPARIGSPRITNIPASTVDIYPTIMELLKLPGQNQPVLDGVSLVSVIDGVSDTRTRPMGFWKSTVSGISTPSDKWMREELQAQQAGGDYHDRSRLVLDAGDLSTSWPRDRHPGHAAWLNWPWKLHQMTNGKRPNAPVRLELYNLADDPMESHDLSVDQPDRVRDMQQQLNDWLSSVSDSLNGEDYQ